MNDPFDFSAENQGFKLRLLRKLQRLQYGGEEQ